MLRSMLIIVVVLLMQAAAHAAPFRQLTPPARTSVIRGPVYVLNNSVIVQAAPRVERPDPWETMRADYFKRTYGGRGYCR